MLCLSSGYFTTEHTGSTVCTAVVDQTHAPISLLSPAYRTNSLANRRLRSLRGARTTSFGTMSSVRINSSQHCFRAVIPRRPGACCYAYVEREIIKCRTPPLRILCKLCSLSHVRTYLCVLCDDAKTRPNLALSTATRHLLPYVIGKKHTAENTQTQAQERNRVSQLPGRRWRGRGRGQWWRGWW